MVKLRVPPSAQSDIQTMRHFYSRIGAMPQYDHCHEVYKKAVGADIVDESVIRDRRESPERRWANVTLRRLALAHSLDFSALAGTARASIPAVLRDRSVQEELDIFSKLTELERSGAPRSAYAEILNNGKRPLALLIKLADYAVTHDTENQLDGFISDGRPSLIRRYSSVEEAYRAMRMDAKAGEAIYAPVAELFGYPLLAGDIFLHSFRVNHPDIYKFILSSMQDPLMKQKMAHTQQMVFELAKILGNVLHSYGFEADVTIRKEKHDGKKMKKLLSHLSEDYSQSGYRAAGKSLQDYISESIGSFNFERFNDWVAVRAVIYRFRGQNIDRLLGQDGGIESGSQNRTVGVDLERIGDLLDTIRSGPLRLAVKSISDTITSLPELFGGFLGNTVSNAVYYDKANGYRAFHFDTRSVKNDVGRALPFEVQLKTQEWHDIAENGKAAHYYYLSKDEGHAGFVDMIAKAYHDIIHPPEPKSRPFNGAPPSRRSSPSLQVGESKEPEGSGLVTPRRTL